MKKSVIAFLAFFVICANAMERDVERGEGSLPFWALIDRLKDTTTLNNQQLRETYAQSAAKLLLSDELMRQLHESPDEHPCIKAGALTDDLKELLYRYMPDRWIDGNTITRQNNKRVTSVAFSDDSSQISIVSEDGILLKVNNEGNVVDTINYHKSLINSKFIDKNKLLLRTYDHGHEIVDTQNKDYSYKLEGSFKSHTKDCMKVATIDLKNTLKVIDIQTDRVLYTQDNFEYFYPYFSPEGNMMVINATDNDARIVDLATAKEIATIKHSHDNADLFFAESSKILAVEPPARNSNDNKGSLNIVDTKTGAVLEAIQYDGRLQWAELSRDEQKLFIDASTGKNERSLSIIDIKRKEVRPIMKYQDRSPLLADFSSDGSKIFVAYVLKKPEAPAAYAHSNYTGIVSVVDTKIAEEIQKIEHDGCLLLATLSGDERTVLTGFADGTVRILNVLTGSELYKIIDSSMCIPGSFSPDSRMILAAFRNGPLKIIKRATHTFDQALVIKYLSWARNKNKTPSNSDFIKSAMTTIGEDDAQDCAIL